MYIKFHLFMYVFSAFVDIWAMCEGRFHFGGLRYKGNNTRKVAYCSNTNSVMELESEWIKHRKSSSYTAHVVRSSTSCMPWSCRILMGEEYFEFLYFGALLSYTFFTLFG
ncbi:hypothetical protein Ahy_A07g032676 [Arachis hypogaea]|uniref:Secreted protein n=1 Tax=Arachis hypogaea TaxID=3818 RepID=A0A445C7B4_ARAHY|nr:hypothetical protein Ahy_A07g032676 [Arachis hypogaea]